MIWEKYIKITVVEMRPYKNKEDLSEISVGKKDKVMAGGMIARKINNKKDQWYMSKKFFDENYIKV